MTVNTESISKHNLLEDDYFDPPCLDKDPSLFVNTEAGVCAAFVRCFNMYANVVCVCVCVCV